MKNPRNNPPLIEKAKEIGKKGPLILVMTSKTRGRKSLRGETRKSQAEKNESILSGPPPKESKNCLLSRGRTMG